MVRKISPVCQTISSPDQPQQPSCTHCMDLQQCPRHQVRHSQADTGMIDSARRHAVVRARDRACHESSVKRFKLAFRFGRRRDVASDQAESADHSSVYGSTTCMHTDRRRGLARVAQRYRPDTMPNMIHKARRFLPLVCYLVTGTAVTTVSQVIANKVNERRL